MITLDIKDIITIVFIGVIIGYAIAITTIAIVKAIHKNKL